jgi:hypothetical protein
MSDLDEMALKTGKFLMMAHVPLRQRENPM